MATILYESYYGITPFNTDYIQHYQVKGAKHGVRRYQNYDGSLTPLGREHYGVGEAMNSARTDKDRPSPIRNSGRYPQKESVGDKLRTFKRDWDEGRRIARAEKAEAKEARAKEHEAKAKAKAEAKANAAADKKAKEAAKEQELLRGVIARADADEVRKYIPRLSTKQLEEVKSRIALQKDIVSTRESQLKSQQTIDKIRKEYADAEAKAKAEQRAARKEKVANVINTGKKIIDKINRVDENTRAAKEKAQTIIMQNREKAAERLGEATRATMEKAKASAYDTAKAVDKVIIDTMTGGRKPKQTADELINNVVRNAVSGASGVGKEVANSVSPAKSAGERIAEKIADKSVNLLNRATGRGKQIAGTAAEKVVEHETAKQDEEERKKKQNK